MTEMSGNDGAMDIETKTTQERLEREAAFHDHSFSTDLRVEEVDKYYAVAKRSYDCYYKQVLQNAAGKRVLEYGCGTGSSAFEIIKHGAREVVGIDISPVAIELSQKKAREENVEDRTQFLVMNAEKLEFPDNSFDLVCGIGILHHLDLERSYSELSRVLRPGGIGVFHEPLGHNPLINRFRNKTPHLRTPDEHPLLMADIKHARNYFEDVKVRYFHLASLGIVPLRNSPLFKTLYSITEAADKLIMGILPPLKGWAWFSVLELKNKS